jgi:hypothetical protein
VGPQLFPVPRLAFTRDGYEIAYQQPCRKRDPNSQISWIGMIWPGSYQTFQAMSLDHNRLAFRSGRERCEWRGDMQTSAANTKIARENKACALREKP